MIEKPPPLVLSGTQPKATLKAMLEATDRRDKGEPYVSPLSEVDPMALDELMNRMDTGTLALLQIPDPKDTEKLVAYFWSLHDQFIREQQLGIVNKPKRGRQPAQSITTMTESVADILGSIGDTQ
jgi:hypothetical protein